MRKNIFHASESEKRLLSLDINRRHDLVDEAENSDGSLVDASAESKLESGTQKLVTAAQNIEVSWKEWTTSFFRKGVAYDRKLESQISLAAEERIREQSNLAIGRIRGFFLRGKRRMYLDTKDRIEQTMRSDMQTALQDQVKQSTERESTYSGLANLLRDATEPLTLDAKSRKTLTASLQRLEKKSQTTEARPATELGDEWQSELAIEEMVTKELLHRNIVSPSEIDDLLQRNIDGDTTLQDLISADATLRGEPKLLKSLVRSVKSLRRGTSRYYRLQKFMVSDPNSGTVSRRLEFLQNTPRVLGKPLKISLGLGNVVDTYIANRGPGFVLLRYGNRYCVLDTQANEVTYKDDAGAFHDYPLKEESLSLAL